MSAFVRNVASVNSKNGKPKFQECGKVFLLDPNRVRPFPDQIRKRFRGIPELAQSIKAVGQTTPIKVRLLEDGGDFDAELVDGERRLRACLSISRHVKAIVDDDITSVEIQYEHCVAANFGKQDHDPIEIADAVSRFRAQGKTIEEIADLFGKSITWVSQYLSLKKLAPAVQQMLVPQEASVEDAANSNGSGLGRDRLSLPFSIGLLLVRLAQDVQVNVANKIMGDKMSATGARRLVLSTLRDTDVGTKRRFRPIEEWRSLEKLAAQTKERFGVFLDMQMGEFAQVIKATTPANRGAVEEALRNLAAEIAQLADSVKAIKK